MASWDDVRRIALDLPETTEDSGRDGLRQWKVKTKSFAWERPLRKSDLQALGDAAPEGPIIGVRTPDVGAKEALLADGPEAVFTTPHFNGYPALLVELDRIDVADLDELLVEAWLAQAPKRLASQYLQENRAQ